MTGGIVCGAVIEDWIIPFPVYTVAETRTAVYWDGDPPKSAIPVGDLNPQLIYGSLGYVRQPPKRRLDLSQ